MLSADKNVFLCHYVLVVVFRQYLLKYWYTRRGLVLQLDNLFCIRDR